MEIPYLLMPPDVIPIDLGRRLFVDDFLIGSTSLERVNHPARYHPASPVLGPEKPWETRGESKGLPMSPAMVFSDGVWYGPRDREFKMWCMCGKRTRCLLTSKDGLIWNKPEFDVIPGTNMVSPRKRE